MLRFDKATYLSLLPKLILSERTSINLRGPVSFTIFSIHEYSVHFVLHLH